MNVGRRLLYMFAGAGISHIIGIPFVSSIIARLLDGVAFGAETTAEYIHYQDATEGNQIIGQQLQQGATIDRLYNNPDGTLAVKYDTSAYTGGAIDVDTLGEDWI